MKYWGVASVKKNRVFVGLGLVVTAVWLLLLWNTHYLPLPALNVAKHFQYVDNEHKAGSTYKIKDEKGVLLTIVSRRVLAGDELITSNGNHYRIQKVDSNSAAAKFLGMDKEFLAYNEYFSEVTIPAAATEWSKRPVAIYHTHTDESYLPSDGRFSIPFNGGIIQVGDSYKTTLSREGVNVLHDKTPHDPHDNNAYYRSRRTAFQLMKKNPIAIFDIHRDGVDDPEIYREYIDNKNVAQIRIVVGRQNPHMATNLDFAKRMMAYANKINPTIVNEIFIAHGNYNQDLMSTAVLLEAGTYTNQKEEAIKGVQLLASAVPMVLGITGPPEKPDEEQSGAWSALVWIMALTLFSGGAFALLNAGSLKGAKKRLSYFYRAELAGVLSSLFKTIPIEDWRKTVGEKKKKLFGYIRRLNNR